MTQCIRFVAYTLVNLPKIRADDDPTFKFVVAMCPSYRNFLGFLLITSKVPILGGGRGRGEGPLNTNSFKPRNITYPISIR